MGQASIENQATTGNGINMTGAGATVGMFGCTLNVQSAASTYAVTGVAGSYFFQLNNNYTHVADVVTRNVKFKNTVTLLTYASSLVSTA